ncbi:hypothetical protein [Mycobacterium uberis]|nr:hypothetical protein [Mycobacterium uberis]
MVHTNAECEQTKQTLDLDVTAGTHLFNAMLSLLADSGVTGKHII